MELLFSLLVPLLLESGVVLRTISMVDSDFFLKRKKCGIKLYIFGSPKAI